MLKLFATLHVLLLLSIGFTVEAAQITPQTPKSNPPPKPSNQSGRPLPTPPQGACKSEASKSPILVLSIDSASVRGIAQFELLLAIEDQVNAVLAAEAGAAKQPFTRLNITEIFDFFAGTSCSSGKLA